MEVLAARADVPTEVGVARVPMEVQSFSAARWGHGRGFTRVVLECLNGNLGSLFGHAELTAGEPEYVFRFME
jgi:hypothetical protein